MKILVDMNLSPDWVTMLQSQGWTACHWSAVGAHNAPDSELMEWARDHQHIIITQDLDFTQLLFSSGAIGPSVILLRIRDEFDSSAHSTIFRAVHQAADALNSGALLTISAERARLRRLPIP